MPGDEKSLATTEPDEHEKIAISGEMLKRGVKAFLLCRDLMYETKDEAVQLIIKAVLGSRASFPDDQ